MSNIEMSNVRIVDSIESSDLILSFCFNRPSQVNIFVDVLSATILEASLEYRFHWFSFIREPEERDSPNAQGPYDYTLTLRRWFRPEERNRLNWRPFVEREVRDGIHPLCCWIDDLKENVRLALRFCSGDLELERRIADRWETTDMSSALRLQ